MASKKREAATTAPASKEPAAAKRKPGSKKAGVPTRTEKKQANKARHRIVTAAAQTTANKVVSAGKEIGAAIVSRPPAPERERYWRKPDVAWTDELGEDLFILMSTGHGMQDIAKLDGMPSVYQMMRWFADEKHPFSSCRTRAQEQVVPFYEELAKDIAMTSNPQTIVTRKQVLTKDGDIEDLVEERVVDNVERSKLAVVALQWTLSHLKPKKHGRNPDLAPGRNEQLEGLFAALKAGPK